VGDERKVGKRGTTQVENKGGKGKSDLKKKGHMRLLNECA
jgi:hypothetical protein